MKQEAPFALQIEPVEGCSLACSFCALQTLRDNGADWHTGKHGTNSAPYRFMERGTLRHLLQLVVDAGWNPRVEFAMHGEPTMHPDLPGLVQDTRKALPKASIMVTTNGSGILTPEKAMALFRSGINTLAFDDYKHAKWRKKVHEVLLYCHATYALPLMRYPKERAASPHTRHSGKRIVIIGDISELHEGTHQLTNQGGNSGNKEADPLEKRCAKPFRELAVRWDGNVALCCDDWRGQYKIGNVKDYDYIEELWNHVSFVAARTALYAARRDMITVCSGCNVRTYRNGLLPDKFGKGTMHKPNPYTESCIRSAERGRTFSIKLKRGD